MLFCALRAAVDAWAEVLLLGDDAAVALLAMVVDVAELLQGAVVDDFELS